MENFGGTHSLCLLKFCSQVLVSQVQLSARHRTRGTHLAIPNWIKISLIQTALISINQLDGAGIRDCHFIRGDSQERTILRMETSSWALSVNDLLHATTISVYLWVFSMSPLYIWIMYHTLLIFANHGPGTWASG